MDKAWYSYRFISSLYIVFLRRTLAGWSTLNSSIFGNIEGSPYRKFSFSQRKGAVPGTGPGVLRSGNPEAGVLPGTMETEEDIRRMFHEARNKMKNRITLKKKSDPGKFAIPCLVKVIKPHTSSGRIDDDRGLIAACQCGTEYYTEYSASIEIHTPTSIDSANQKSIENYLEESIDSSPDDLIEDFPEGPIDSWENGYYNSTFADYEEERATAYRGICSEEDRLLNHSYGIRNATLIDRTIPPSIDTHHYHDHHHESYAVETTICERRADEFDEGFTTEELFNHQEHPDTYSLLEVACGKGTRFYHPFTRAKRPSIDNKASTSIDNLPKPPSNERETSKQNIDYLTPDEFGIFRDPEGYTRAMDGHALKVSREDIADILKMANGVENLFKQQHNTAEHQQRVTNGFYDAAGGVDDRFKPKLRQHTRPSIDIDVPTSIDRRPKFGKRAYDRDGIRRFHLEQKDEYGVYKDDHGNA
ncbi:hypothetical protein F2Q69_00013886 [Brassica cretica]|uniref:Uncharacterized protein n=1 Tax=Brassica cretica TaxID=69181 RepID=A0A8S9R6F6_BRACR|nr:hypothetical protein F2Q69_00013886 [Brassica cretica]